jgi:hypothetical protein
MSNTDYSNEIKGSTIDLATLRNRLNIANKGNGLLKASDFKNSPYFPRTISENKLHILATDFFFRIGIIEKDDIGPTRSLVQDYEPLFEGIDQSTRRIYASIVCGKVLTGLSVVKGVVSDHYFPLEDTVSPKVDRLQEFIGMIIFEDNDHLERYLPDAS